MKELFRKIIPSGWMYKGNLKHQIQDVFSYIYQHNLWGNSESVSGPGSTIQRTADIRQQLSLLLKAIKARTLMDAPCGDFNWMKELDLADYDYIGIDIVPILITENQRKYTNPTRKFLYRDITRDRLPKADVIICRDCLVHFSNTDIIAALRNFKKSRSTYLLSTSFVRLGENVNIKTGEWRPINLQIAPFNLPLPLHIIDEKCLHTDGTYADKIMGLWQLDDIHI